MNELHPVLNLECPQCCKGFKVSVNLRVHALEHTSSKPFRCESCGGSFSRNRSGTGGTRKGPRLLCKHCYQCLCNGSGAPSQAASDEGISKKNGNRKRNPESELKTLKKNKLSEKNKTRMNTSVEKDGGKYITNMKMRATKVHVGVIPDKKSGCMKSSSTRSNRLRHPSTVCVAETRGSREKPISCAVCGKSFAQKSQLMIHLVKSHPSARRGALPEVHGEKAPPVQCTECGQSFAKMRFLNIHRARKHRAPKCHQGHRDRRAPGARDESFLASDRPPAQRPRTLLKNHNARPGQAVRKGHLTEPSGQHMEDPNQASEEEIVFFGCDKCARSFASRRNLNIHVAVKHPVTEIEQHREEKARENERKVFVCGMCSKSFVKKGYLLRHVKGHLMDECHLPMTESNSLEEKCGGDSGTARGSTSPSDVAKTQPTDTYALIEPNNNVAVYPMEHAGTSSCDPQALCCDLCKEEFHQLASLRNHILSNHFV